MGCPDQLSVEINTDISMTALTAQTDFVNTSTHWNFFLVTGEYDDVVAARVTQQDRPVGLYLD
jgi:hypothetical protein